MSKAVTSASFYADSLSKAPQENKVPEPKSTPIRKGYASTGLFTSNHVYQDPAIVLAAREMENKFAEIPTSEFLGLLPDHPGMPNVGYAPFKNVATTKVEKDMYDPFVSLTSLAVGWLLL